MIANARIPTVKAEPETVAAVATEAAPAAADAAKEKDKDAKA